MKLSALKRIQADVGYTLCAGREHFLYVSHARGIAPIMRMVKKDPFYFHDCIVTDSVIGKASAMMLCRSHVSYIHGHIMSESAEAFLKEHKIAYSYDILCPYIINRTKDGMCPMEQSVQGIMDMEEAYQALCHTLNTLQHT